MLSTAQKIAQEVVSVFKEKAKENLKVSGENFGKGIQISEEPIEIKPIVAIKEVAKVASVSHDTIAKVKVIQATAKGAGFLFSYFIATFY